MNVCCISDNIMPFQELFFPQQIGLAVGDANEEKEKAQFTKIKVRVRGLLSSLFDVRFATLGNLMVYHNFTQCLGGFHPGTREEFQAPFHKVPCTIDEFHVFAGDLSEESSSIR